MRITSVRRLSAIGLAMATAFAVFMMTAAPDGGVAPATALAKSDKAQGGDHGGKPRNKGEPAKAGGPSGDDDASEQRIEDAVIDGVLDGVFGEDERAIIETYARERGVGTTSLPPGLAKNVQRGKPLPPGIAKRGLPQDLENRLPPLREGLERIIVGDDVTIIEEGTRIVVDVLKDVLAGR